MNSRTILASIIPALMVACGGSQGTQPHDMSMAEHQAAARNEDQASQGHSAQYNPAATETKQVCGKAQVCWTSIQNPTEQHKQDADRHHELAMKHRAAAGALVAAENESCAGIDQADRDMTPFEHREDIASVKPIEEDVKVKQDNVKRLKGAEIVFRAVPGMTAEWLQRSINCHMARAAAVGFDMAEMSDCPLMLKNIKATVASVGDGFAVRITSDDKATAEKILSRAQALIPSSGVAAN